MPNIEQRIIAAAKHVSGSVCTIEEAIRLMSHKTGALTPDQVALAARQARAGTIPACAAPFIED